jgi:hypothetical protein
MHVSQYVFCPLCLGGQIYIILGHYLDIKPEAWKIFRDQWKGGFKKGHMDGSFRIGPKCENNYIMWEFHPRSLLWKNLSITPWIRWYTLCLSNQLHSCPLSQFMIRECLISQFMNNVVMICFLLRQSHCVAQIGLKHMILLPQPPEIWGYK